jgi:hypothetical protein
VKVKVINEGDKRLSYSNVDVLDDVLLLAVDACGGGGLQ